MPAGGDANLGYEYDAGCDRAWFQQWYPIESLQYRMQKERFVTGSPGSTPVEVAILGLISATSLIMNHLVAIHVNTRSSVFRFLIEFACVPIVIAIALLYPDYAMKIWLAQVALVATILVFSKTPSLASNRTPELLQRSRLRFLTWFRSAFMLCTCCCILAVDFPLFSRRLSKTESFGISAMDVGVGFVVLSSGIVSRQARCGPRSSLLQILKSVSPVLIMGFIRLGAIRAVDYQTHLSEYGVHWNFFFTLAMVSLVAFIASPLVECISAAGVAAGASLISQLLISLNIDFLLNGQRQNLVSANREGIFSLLGYLSIYFAGVEIGQRISRAKSIRDWWRLAAQLAAVSTACFVFIAIVGARAVSRRFANLPFVIWILAMNAAMLALELSYDLVSVHGQSDCKILNGIDRNQLAIFLLSNLFTGIINLTVQTLYVSDYMAVLLMTLYLFLVCAVAAVLDQCHISLKFW